MDCLILGHGLYIRRRAPAKDQEKTSTQLKLNLEAPSWTIARLTTCTTGWMSKDDLTILARCLNLLWPARLGSPVHYALHSIPTAGLREVNGPVCVCFAWSRMAYIPKCCRVMLYLVRSVSSLQCPSASFVSSRLKSAIR